MAETRFTPGPWEAVRVIHEDTGAPMTPDEVGEYVRNSVVKSASESGTTDFLIVLCEKEDGPADVCHVGNGPTSPANAHLIAAAPDLYEALEAVMAHLRGEAGYSTAHHKARAALAKARGESDG